MKRIILCEGTTNLILMQFILQYKYNWRYEGFNENNVTNRLVKKILKKNNNLIEIQSCAGITEIPKALYKIKDQIELSMSESELYDKIIILVDHDTISSNHEFIEKINEEIDTTFHENDLEKWIEWVINSEALGEVKTKLYIKSIPETETGAIENVMLSALGTDEIECLLIGDSKKFISNISKKQKRYLQKESQKSKAIFNTYFAIRSPEEKYDERARILQAFDWKNNEVLKDSFSFLELL